MDPRCDGPLRTEPAITPRCRRELADAGLRDENDERLARALSTTNVSMRRIDHM